jgi:hypothetical protein
MEVFASATPFASPIFPLRHMAAFGDISAAEIDDLAGVLRNLPAKGDLGLESPDLNFTVRSGPSDCVSARVCERDPSSYSRGGIQTQLRYVQATGFCPKRPRNFFVT